MAGLPGKYVFPYVDLDGEAYGAILHGTLSNKN